MSVKELATLIKKRNPNLDEYQILKVLQDLKRLMRIDKALIISILASK